jgi:hypothetical protein
MRLITFPRIMQALGFGACAAVAYVFSDHIKVLVIFTILAMYFLLEIFFGERIARYAYGELEKRKNKV